ncbi:hypothetical protein SERN_1329 [Serinibacter arcticus]|uniref:Uncharacterized protein n=1 Tax=Serinibacter arcticus TaxID=1655435 RepID=A0A4Z1E040_9MICO|nr:hypothetical protein SERN_1329 [Serinibacter arcticus]
MLPLVAIVLFFVLRGNGVGAFWLPFAFIIGIGVISRVLRRGSFRD